MMVLGPNSIRRQPFPRIEIARIPPNRAEFRRIPRIPGSYILDSFDVHKIVLFPLFFRSEIGRAVGFPAKSALPKPLFCANSINTATPRRRQNRPKIVPKPPPSPPQTVRRKSYSNERLLTPKSYFFRSFSWFSYTDGGFCASNL